MEAFEALLDEQNMLRSELTTKDSLIEEQKKEIKVNVQNYVCICLIQVV